MYSKYILPRLLKWKMGQEQFIRERKWCIPQASGTVLEIGYGGGANLPYYDPEKVQKLIVLEPNKELLDLANVETELDVDFLEGYAEDTPLENESVDYVVFTWTLCSVSSVEDVLRDMYRVLKTNGKVVFVEHGKSQVSLLSKIQSLANPLWSRCAGGCQLNRSYFSIFEKVGFDFEYKEQVGTAYRGVAIK